MNYETETGHSLEINISSICKNTIPVTLNPYVSSLSKLYLKFNSLHNRKNGHSNIIEKSVTVV
jgi:hypothetical protein